MAKKKQISPQKESNLDDAIPLDELCLRHEIDFGSPTGHIRTFKPDERARSIISRLIRQEKKKK